ncbi:MAG: hypothetical protein HY321_03960 [Armatimonadetes bacterium]|nr:hypothetical protein [Armatimonadota bacterium]
MADVDVVVAVDNQRLRAALCHRVQHLGYSCRAVASAGLQEVRGSDRVRLIFVETNDDVAKLEQSILDFCRATKPPNCRDFPIVPLVSVEQARRSPALHFRADGAVLCTVASDDHNLMGGLARLLSACPLQPVVVPRDDIAAPARQGTGAPRDEDQVTETTGPRNHAHVQPICPKIRVAIDQEALRRALAGALRRTGREVVATDAVRALAATQADAVVIGTGEDVALLVRLVNILHGGRPSRRPSAMVAVVPGSAVVFNPSLKSWTITGQPAVSRVLWEEDRDLGRTVVRVIKELAE